MPSCQLKNKSLNFGSGWVHRGNECRVIEEGEWNPEDTEG